MSILENMGKSDIKFLGGNRNQGKSLHESEIKEEPHSYSSHKNITRRDIEKREVVENVECVYKIVQEINTSNRKT